MNINLSGLARRLVDDNLLSDEDALQLMFVTAIIGVLGLFTHFWQKFGNWSAVTQTPAPDVAQPIAPGEALIEPVRSAVPQGEPRNVGKRFARGNMV